jgi:uncharacterized protein (TIGR02722 family)
MNKMNIRFLLMMIYSAMLFISGCMAYTKNLNPEDDLHYDATYDFSDKKQIVDRLVSPLLSNAPFFPVRVKPILIVYPVVNETSEHINTSGITDEIRMKLIQSGKFRFINEHQRVNIMEETDYQYQGYVDPAQVEQGRQLGADYILSGTLRSIKKKQPKQWRLNKKERIYYSLDLTMTDLKTGEIVYADQAELAREASKPIIGW